MRLMRTNETKRAETRIFNDMANRYVDILNGILDVTGVQQ